MNSPIGMKDKPWNAKISLYSGETTNTILAGQPVVLSVVNGVAKIVLPSTAGGAVAHSLCTGVAVTNVPPGDPGEVIASGYAHAVRIVTQTRAASTDSYASVASRPAGAVFTIDTARDLFTYSAASTTAPPLAVLVESLASIASAASNAADTSLYRTAMAKMWLRTLA